MFPLAAEKRAGKAGAPRSGGADSLLARAPKLKESADRIVASVVKALQTMAGPATTIEGMVAGFALDKARTITTRQSAETALGAIELPDRGCTLLAALDATLVHAVVELLCGGNGAEPPAVAPRAVTPIDQQFAHTVFTLAAAAIQTECEETGIGKARATKVETPLAADLFGPRVEEVGGVNLTIGIFGLHGTFRLFLPPKALEAFAGETMVEAAGETPDPLWTTRLRQEIERAPVALAAYLEAKDISLGVLAGLKAGQILALPAEARSHATLVSDGRVLFRGEIGQEDERYSLRIDEVVAEPGGVALMAARRAPYFEVSKV